MTKLEEITFPSSFRTLLSLDCRRENCVSFGQEFILYNFFSLSSHNSDFYQNKNGINDWHRRNLLLGKKIILVVSCHNGPRLNRFSSCIVKLLFVITKSHICCHCTIHSLWKDGDLSNLGKGRVLPKWNNFHLESLAKNF